MESEKGQRWFHDHRMWLELYALINLFGLAPDIFLAHSVNLFDDWVEYVPLVFSLAVPLALVPAVWALPRGRWRVWRVSGNLVGWSSVIVGIAGLVLHLDSWFFRQWTLASLVYAAPFAAPLAYTGIGLLLIMNRSVDHETREWPLWVMFLALGGFFGNFVFSVTDHAQNGFFHVTEWIPVISSALAVGFLIVPLLVRVDRRFLRICGVVMLLQALVGVAGFFLHGLADLHGQGPTLFDRVVYGAPIFAPLLFADLVLLAAIGLIVLYRNTPENAAGLAQPAAGAAIVDPMTDLRAE